MISCYPHDDDITLYLFYTIVEALRLGLDGQVRRQRRELHPGPSRRVALDLGRREHGDDRLQPESVAARKERAGKPMAIAFSEVDPTPIWAQTAATFNDSPHPNAARLFLSWLLQKEQQTKLLDTWSVRVDVPPPAGMPPVFSLMLANRYAEFLGDAR